MDKFKNYIFLTSLTLLFILVGGILGNKVGMILAITIVSAVYIYSYYFTKEQREAMKEKKVDTKSTDNDDVAIYAIVERLVKRTDLAYKKDK